MRMNPEPPKPAKAKKVVKPRAKPKPKPRPPAAKPVTVDGVSFDGAHGRRALKWLNTAPEADLRAKGVYGRSVNISTTGMLVSVWPHPEVGSEVTLAFRPSQLLDEFVSHLWRTHLGLKIIGRNRGAGDQNTLLARLGLLGTTVEKECHMRVLLRLSDMKLT